MYLRFVLSCSHPNSGVRERFFLAAYELSRRRDLPKLQAQELGELLSWSEENLRPPGRYNRTRSKGYYRRTKKGISSIKSNAETHIDKLRNLIAILQDHGFHVTKIKSRNPGYIVYEDEHQVVAEPFRSTPTWAEVLPAAPLTAPRAGLTFTL